LNTDPKAPAWVFARTDGGTSCVQQSANDMMVFDRAKKIALFNDTTPDRHFGCDLVVSEINKRLGSFEITWRHHVNADWRDDPFVRTNGLDVDAVVVNGEGTLHHSASWQRAKILSEVGPYARDKLRVPCFLINAGIHELDECAARNIGRFSHVYVRDSHSQRELGKFRILSTVVPDLTMTRGYEGADRRQGILATDSVIDPIAEAIAARANISGWSYRPILYNKNEDGGRSAAEAYAKMLSSHRLVVSGRFHVVALCLATRTPFVAIESRTPKISGLLEDAFGSTSRVIPEEKIRTFDPNAYLDWTHDEERALEAFLSRTRARADKMFDEIGTSLRKPTATLKRWLQFKGASR
jgi:hypothetical protein